jgi:hypothetical protein
MSSGSGHADLGDVIERIVSGLHEVGPVVLVFGGGWWTAHLSGLDAPSFHDGLDSRRWHTRGGGVLGEWIMDVDLDAISDVQFVREPNPFPDFPGEESLTVRFLGPDGASVLHAFLDDLYDDRRQLSEDRLAAWSALRDAYSQPERDSIVVGEPAPAAA